LPLWYYFGGPDIDYDFSIVFNPITGTGSLSGRHDGYPSYIVRVNGDTVYYFAEGWFPELLGLGDVQVNRPIW
jgi:hypothetical protein